MARDDFRYGCSKCASIVVTANRINCELSDEIEEVKEFTELPKELSFPLVEYQTMLDQAKRMVESFKKRKSIGRTASPLNSHNTE